MNSAEMLVMALFLDAVILAAAVILLVVRRSTGNQRQTAASGLQPKDKQAGKQKEAKKEKPPKKQREKAASIGKGPDYPSTGFNNKTPPDSKTGQEKETGPALNADATGFKKDKQPEKEVAPASFNTEKYPREEDNANIEADSVKDTGDETQNAIETSNSTMSDAFSVFTEEEAEETEANKMAKNLNNVDIFDLSKEAEDLKSWLKGW